MQNYWLKKSPKIKRLAFVLGLLLVSQVNAESVDPYTYYVLNGDGILVRLGSATNRSLCELALSSALRDIPAGIKQELGPPPYKFQCVRENSFKPGWDCIAGYNCKK